MPVGFVGNFAVPRDHGRCVRVAVDGQRAARSTSALLGIFAVQHSVMARPFFKRWLTRFIPESAERSTYVLFSSARVDRAVRLLAAARR